jgi:hypothetical protein
MQRTQKVSVALDKRALVAARAAATAQGLSLSAFLMRLLNAHLEREARFEHMAVLVREFASEGHVTPAQMQAIRNEMNAPLKPIGRAKRKRAA